MPIVLNGRRALLGVDVSYFEDREFCRNQGILLHQLISLIRGSSFDPEESSEFSLIDSYLLRSEFKQLEAWSLENSTIPKNELQGLTAGSNLGWAVEKALEGWIKEKIVASDSTIALSWTTAEMKPLAIFHKN